MPNGIDEDTDIDLFEEDDFGIDDENSDAGGDDDQYAELVKRAREEAEAAVVEALVNEDTNSGVYKGLQKVLAKRDRQLKDQQAYIEQLAQAISEYRDANSPALREVEFIKQILPEMLDPDSKKIFDNKRSEFMNSKRASDLEEQLRRQQMQQNVQQYRPVNNDDYEEQLKKYKEQAISQMKEFAEFYGVDPNDKRLDFGEETENYVTRLARLKESMGKIKKEDEDLNSVRRKNVPNTRSRGEQSSRSSSRGQDLISRGLAQAIKRIQEQE